MEKSIIVENLGKKYDISKLQKDTQFREALINFVKRSLFRDHESNEVIWALKNVSFSVEKGEIVGIIGRNGAGKSTLLKILSKITYPTCGKMKILGKVGSLLEVGTGFHDELSGRENIFLNGSILGMKKKEVSRKLDEIIAFSEVEKFIDTPIKRYSTGMRLKLGFSVAAHLETDILFIDEVLAVGDVAFQKKCLDTIKELRNSGRTVLFVSHSIPTVESLCPRVIWIDKGEIRKDGAVEEITNNYMSEFATVKHATGFDLTKAFEREGTGEIRFTKMEYLNADGTPKNLIRSGDSLKVRIHYQVYQPVSNPDFNFRIYTERGGKVASFGNLILGDNLSMLSLGVGYADIDIDNLNIMPDRYFINLWVYGGKEKEYIDHIVFCSTLDVEASNYYKTGRGIDKGWGITFLQYKWKFGNNSLGKNSINQ